MMNPRFLRSFLNGLFKEGYEVISAQDGEEALNKIRKEDPDLIVLDIMMPKKNGFEVLEEIRSRPKANKWLPVIIVSAKDQFDDIRKGYNLDADYYITKPCSLDIFMNGIKTMVSLIPLRNLAQENFK